MRSLLPRPGNVFPKRGFPNWELMAPGSPEPERPGGMPRTILGKLPAAPHSWQRLGVTSGRVSRLVATILAFGGARSRRAQYGGSAGASPGIHGVHRRSRASAAPRHAFRWAQDRTRSICADPRDPVEIREWGETPSGRVLGRCRHAARHRPETRRFDRISRGSGSRQSARRWPSGARVSRAWHRP